MLFQAQERKIHQYLYQVHNMWFQAQEREIHQYPYQIKKKMQYSVAVPSTREGYSPIPVPLDVPPGMRALHLRVKKMELCLQIQQIVSIL